MILPLRTKYLFYGLLAMIILLPWRGLAQVSSFALSPSKLEIKLAPGESVIRNLYVKNLTSADADFSINVEDVSGSNDTEAIVTYYGSGLGPYSIKNYVVVDTDHINVAAGETKAVPIMISLPTTARPGGLYGGVFISPVKSAQKSGPNISPRLGLLVFLRVKGKVEEQGQVQRFDAGAGQKIFWTNGPIDFQVAFKNTGNVHLNPYGQIELKNWSGQVVDRLLLEPWYVFPDALRTRLMTWTKPPLFGYFTATLILNHGYTVPSGTTMSYNFFIIPLPLLAGLLVLLVLIFVVYKVISRAKKWQI